jgi:hypothetical protein
MHIYLACYLAFTLLARSLLCIAIFLVPLAIPEQNHFYFPMEGFEADVARPVTPEVFVISENCISVSE